MVQASGWRWADTCGHNSFKRQSNTNRLVNSCAPFVDTVVTALCGRSQLYRCNVRRCEDAAVPLQEVPHHAPPCAFSCKHGIHAHALISCRLTCHK